MTVSGYAGFVRRRRFLTFLPFPDSRPIGLWTAEMMPVATRV
jgi:hypothetical protein